MPCKSTICLGVFAALSAAAIAHRPIHAQVPAPPGAPAAALYEQGPKEKAINRYVGSVTWRTEMVSAGVGQAAELAIKGEAIIPKRGIAMSWLIRRNSDKSLPASHVIEIIFKLPAKAPHGKVVDVTATHMKQGENTPGTALSGRGVKVTEDFFMIGLTATEAHRVINDQLLTERPWIDVGFLYENGTRGMMALEKGPTGKHAFTEAFTAWARPLAPRLR
jgi:hypothetical protein